MPNPTTDVRQVDPIEAQRLAAGGAVLLDVREDDEWVAGHIAGAVHLHLSHLHRIGEVLAPGGPTIVAVCRSGNRSNRAAEALVRIGYDAVNLAGGMRAWEAAGLPVVDPHGHRGMVI